MSSAADQKPTGGSEDPGLRFVEVEGVNILNIFEINRPLTEHVQMLKALDMRSDDVLLLAFPKSGTHWVWEITSMLLAGSADYEKRCKQMAMMEATEIEKIVPQPSPRVLNTHLPLRLLNHQGVKDKGVKVIHVYRNAKGVLASDYFHNRQLAGEGMTVEASLHMVFTEGVPGMKYVKYMKEMDEWHKANPEVPFFLTSFEDNKQDPQRVIRNLAEFLGVAASPQLIKDIAEATSITKMKEADKQKQNPVNPKIQIYRKGQVGDWKNHLTVAQSEVLDEKVKALKSCDYHFRYTL